MRKKLNIFQRSSLLVVSVCWDCILFSFKAFHITSLSTIVAANLNKIVADSISSYVFYLYLSFKDC